MVSKYWLITLLLFPLTLGPIVSHETSSVASAQQQAARSPCPRAIQINTNYQFRGGLHFICLQRRAGALPQLNVIQFSTGQVIFSREVLEATIDQMASFVDQDGSLRVIVGDSRRVNGTSVYSINSAGQFINEKHTINSQLVRAISVWKLELNYEWQLAIANERILGPYSSGESADLTGNQVHAKQRHSPGHSQPLGPIISIHSWRSTYFDKYQLIELPQEARVNKLEPMHINGQEFLIVALEALDQEHLAEQQQEQSMQQLSKQQREQYLHHGDPIPPTNSLIYKLDFGDANLNWVQHQTLATRVALDASSFAVTHRHSLQRDYYIAIVGQASSAAAPSLQWQQPLASGGPFEPNSYQSSNNNSTNQLDSNQFGLVIYKYFGDRFLAYRSIGAPTATKLDTITYGWGDSYVIIALASAQTNSISIYLFDGLNLSRVPGPQTAPPSHYGLPPVGQEGRVHRRSMEPPAALRLFINPAATVGGSPATVGGSPATVQDQETLGLESGQKGNTSPKNESSPSTTSKRDQLSEPPIPMPTLAFSNQPHTQLRDPFAIDEQTNQTTANSSSSNVSSLEAEQEVSAELLYQIPVGQLLSPDSMGPNHEDGLKEDGLNHGSLNNNSTQKRAFIPLAPRQPLGPELLNWCKSTIEQVLKDSLGQLAGQLAELPKIDQEFPIELHGNLTIEGDLHVTNLLYAHKVGRVIRTAPQPFIDHFEPRVQEADYTQAFAQIDETDLNVGRTMQQVEQILVDDGTLQKVYTPLTFNRLVFECMNPPNSNQFPGPPLALMNPFQPPRCPHLSQMKTVFLNGQDVSNIQEQALLSGRTMIINRDVRFEHLVLLGDTRILDTLNDFQVDEIVFSRGVPPLRPITGRKSLREPLFSMSNLLVERWSGQQVDRSTFLTAGGLQTVPADLKFSQVILERSPRSASSSPDSSRIETINGLHLDTHLDQIARSDRQNNFKLPIRFEELILNGPIHFSPNCRLSSIDMNELWRNTLFKSSPQNVSAPMEFSGEVVVSYGADMLVDGPINGIHIHPDNVLMRDGNYNLQNPFVFHSDVHVDGDLQVGKALNGIQVVFNNKTGQSELAILYDGGEQFLTGDKILNSIHLGGHSHIRGQINGKLDLTQLNSLSDNNGQPFRFPNYRLTTGQGRPVARFDDNAGIHIASAINGVPVQDLCSLAQHASRIPANKYRRLKFTQPISIGNIRCASINGFNNLTNSFLTKYGNQVVRGTLRLASGLMINSTLQIGSSFNNLNVAPLSHAVSKAINESRTGLKEVFGDFSVDDLYVDGQINELQMRDVFIARADYPQIIRAPMSFDHLDIENVLVVGGDIHTGFFNGLNVSEIFTNTMHYDSPQVIYNHVEVENLHILPKSNLETKSLNGIDLQRLYSDAVMIDSPQQVLASKTFNSPLQFNDRAFLRFGIDGLTEDEMKFNLLLQSDELIEGDLEFYQDVLIRKSLEISTGSINDIDLQQFVALLLYERPDKPSLRLVGNSSIRFKAAEVDNLVLGGKIQNIDVSSQAILRNQTQGGDVVLRPMIMPQPWPVVRPIQRPPSQPIPNPYLPGWTAGQMPPVHVIQKEPARIQWPMVMMPRPLNYINQSAIKTTWRPNWSQMGPPTGVIAPPRPVTNLIFPRPPPPRRPYEGGRENFDDLTYNYNFVKLHTNQVGGFQPSGPADMNYLVHWERLRNESLLELSTRINKHLSVSFYYEIAQKHPLLGPLLGDADNPILNQEGSPLLLLRGMSKAGEPCLHRGQTIAVMAPQRSRSLYASQYTLSSQLSDTSQPILAKSLIVNGIYYLFILDLHPPKLPAESMSQVLVYVWDNNWGRYDLRDQIFIDGYPTALRPFAIWDGLKMVACFALANPRVSRQVGKHMTTGPPLIRCQSSSAGVGKQNGVEFSEQHVLPMLTNVFDLDILSAPYGEKQLVQGQQVVLVAALAQQDTEQIGDLFIYEYNFGLKQGQVLDKRRLVKPLRLHFIKRPPLMSGPSSGHHLVVSEAITSNIEAQAMTRIFRLSLNPLFLDNAAAHRRSSASERLLVETQSIKANQFDDIQSVLLDQRRSLLFLQSAHSISIYAPSGGWWPPTDCSPEYVLVQKIPTKGANKFLVVNTNTNLNFVGQQSSSLGKNRTLFEPRGSEQKPFGHLLVLSNDDCERQHYSTLILSARFQ